MDGWVGEREIGWVGGGRVEGRLGKRVGGWEVAFHTHLFVMIYLDTRHAGSLES